jgi:uncharacterized lipoprotein YmbA
LGVSAPVPTTQPLAGRRILVGPFDLPEYLDRPQMAIRDAGGEIRFLEFQRWAEPLDAAFMSTFTDNLIIAAGTAQVIAVPVPQQLPTDFRVMARVSRFDVDTAGQAVLIVQWYASDEQSKVLIAPRQSTYSRTAVLPLKAETSVAALSATVADFAAEVAASLATVPVPESP